MPTRQQLESALINADAAGDSEGARQLANALRSYQEPSAPIDPQKALAEEYSAPERALIGAGRSFAELGQGAKQIGLKAGEALGVVSPEDVESYRQQIVSEKELYERGVGSTTSGQVGEVVGSIAAAVPAILAPGAGAAALSTRLASAAAVSAAEAGLQPVYDEEGFAGEKLKQIGTGGVLGAGSTYGLDKLAEIMPKNLMTKFYKKAQDRGQDSINEADILEGLTGISMTPAEKAGSKGLQMLENVARQSIFAADDLADYDKKVARQGMASINKLLRQISKPRKGAETVGVEVQKAAKQAANDAINTRRSMANRDYGSAEDLSGGGKVVERQNYIDELKLIIDDYQGSDATDAMSIVKQARGRLNRATTPAGEKLSSIVDVSGAPIVSEVVEEGIVKQTVKDAIRDRSFYGNAAKGTGNVFKDLDKNLDRMIAGRLNQAVTKDLIGAEYLGDVGVALKKANDNYAANSKSIQAIEASPLGRLLGKEFDDVMGAIEAGTFNSISGEKAVKNIMKLEPSEIRQTMKALDKINPATADTLRGFVIRDALENSLLPPAAGMQKGSMSFNKFQSNLDKNKLSAYGLSSADSKQINNITSAMKRIGDKAGYNFSGTQVQDNLMNVGDKLASAMMGNAQKGASLALEAVGLRRISSAMTSKEGRDALNTIVKPYQSKTKLDNALRVIERIGIATASAEAGKAAGE